MRTKEQSRVYMANLREMKRRRKGLPKRGRGRPKLPDSVVSPDALRMRKVYARRKKLFGTTGVPERRNFTLARPQKHRFGVHADRLYVGCYGKFKVGVQHFHV